MGDPLRHELAQLAVKVSELRRASLMQKAAIAEECMTSAVLLLGRLVDRIEQLEKEQGNGS